MQPGGCCSILHRVASSLTIWRENNPFSCLSNKAFVNGCWTAPCEARKASKDQVDVGRMRLCRRNIATVDCVLRTQMTLDLQDLMCKCKFWQRLFSRSKLQTRTTITQDQGFCLKIRNKANLLCSREPVGLKFRNNFWPHLQFNPLELFGSQK